MISPDLAQKLREDNWKETLHEYDTTWDKNQYSFIITNADNGEIIYEFAINDAIVNRIDLPYKEEFNFGDFCYLACLYSNLKNL